MTIEEIVADWLKTHGYTGLCQPELNCRCTLKDLMPCDLPSPSCRAGYEHKNGCVHLKKEGDGEL